MTAVRNHDVSVALACRTFRVSETCYRYGRKLDSENEDIADWLPRLTTARRAWGFGHGRSACRRSLVPDFARQTFCVCADVIDDFNREGLGIEVDVSLPADRVFRSLNRIIEWRGKRGVIRVDNGPEYISGTFLAWAEKRNITNAHIQPQAAAKCLHRALQPHGPAYMAGILHARYHQGGTDQATRWLWTYSNDRPNIAIGGISPRQKLKMAP